MVEVNAPRAPQEGDYRIVGDLDGWIVQAWAIRLRRGDYMPVMASDLPSAWISARLERGASVKESFWETLQKFPRMDEAIAAVRRLVAKPLTYDRTGQMVNLKEG